jgi:hypothetical protein
MKNLSLSINYLKNEFHEARNDDPNFENLYKENEFMEYLIDQIESGCILLFNNFDVEE